MKKLTLLLFTLNILGFGVASAQAPQSINYQAIAWNNDNTPRSNQLIRVKISILNQSANGPEVFNEEYQVTTNNQGLFTLEIGSLNLNDFQKINWGNGAKFLQVSIDGILIGTTKMLSVPYALYAESTNLKAGSGIGVNGNTIVNAGDLDNTNEIQTLSLNGSQLSLSKNGGTVLLPTSSGAGTTYSAGTGISISPTNVISTDLKVGEGLAIQGNTIKITGDGDTSAVNELQTLSYSEDGKQLKISNGNAIDLPTSTWLLSLPQPAYPNDTFSSNVRSVWFDIPNLKPLTAPVKGLYLVYYGARIIDLVDTDEAAISIINGSNNKLSPVLYCVNKGQKRGGQTGVWIVLLEKNETIRMQLIVYPDQNPNKYKIHEHQLGIVRIR